MAKGTIGQGEAGQMVAFLEETSDYDAQQLRQADEGRQITPEPVNMYRSEIEEFSQALLDARETCLSGQLGLRSSKILSACYESARTGKEVEI